MEFTNTFTIPVGIDDAFEVLTDLERVAPCMPGAKLETVEDDTYTGRVKVKVGPMSLTYRGTAKVVEADADTHTARIEAKGNEARGGGTANADVSARMTEVDDGTEVVVDTTIDVTGKPAQFGRGVMADVGAKIIDTFAECLARRLAGDDSEAAAGDADQESDAEADAEADADAGAPDAEASEVEAGEEDGRAGDEGAGDDAAGDSADTTTGASAPATAASSGPRRVRSSEPEVDALDLMDAAGDATMKRAVPLLAVLVGIGLVIWLLRRRRG